MSISKTRLNNTQYCHVFHRRQCVMSEEQALWGNYYKYAVWWLYPVRQ